MPQPDEAQAKLAEQINHLFSKYPKVAKAIEDVEVAIEELGEIEKVMLAAREKNLIDPSTEQKVFDTQKKMAVSMDKLAASMQGNKDQQLLGIAMGTHQEASAYFHSIIFSIHYARHAQKHGHIRINERMYSEAFMLLQKSQDQAAAAKSNGKIIIP
jgi:hypothetical protein